MRPPEDEIRCLVGDWIAKAELDFDTVVRLVAEERFRDVVAFPAQQSTEKYLKALPEVRNAVKAVLAPYLSET